MDTVARIGGDEFVVLAPGVDSQPARRRHRHPARRRSSPAHRPRRRDGERVGASVGIAVSVAGRGTAEVLLNEADTAMYQAKSLGGGRVEVFDAALGRQVQQRSHAQRLLQSALDDRRVIAHYQPVVDLATGHVVGFEALARIAEPTTARSLPPAAFIPVAEDSGLVVPPRHPGARAGLPGGAPLVPAARAAGD